MIPDMDDPMGRYWDQPSRDRILVDGRHAVMHADTMRELAKYDCTVPTGVYPGKMWRARRADGWLLCWYGAEQDGRCAIERRPILLVEELNSECHREDQHLDPDGYTTSDGYRLCWCNHCGAEWKEELEARQE
jgi:hypothetical protein